MEYAIVFLILAGIFGLFMAWGIGANDVANAMATSVGSKALSLKQAVIIAAVFEFAGAFLAGGQVTKTIRKGIVDSELLIANPEFLVYGMLSALLAAGVWLLIASKRGLPVSTTHSIVGAIAGFAIVAVGIDAVHWDKLGTIAASWIVSPLLSGTIAIILFMSIRSLILDSADPFERAKRFAPLYMFLSGFVLTLVTVMKGLKHVGLDLTLTQSLTTATIFGVLFSIIGYMLVSRIELDPDADHEFRFASVEKVFAALMIMTACGMAFAHGSNDVANAVGPVAAVVSVTLAGSVEQTSAMPTWVLLLGAVGIVIGLLTYGKRVIATVGQGITRLTPSRGFACELAAATTVVIASGTGIPISTTHTLVGAVLGVGLAHGIGAIDLRVVRTIAVSWVVTLPAGALLSVLFFYLFKGIFS
ncbi:MAG: phosphate transporter [Lysobacteraceae bacterium]|nr:MAG: phosphate transporter [Xanthomonadaceae bacterium]